LTAIVGKHHGASKCTPPSQKRENGAWATEEVILHRLEDGSGSKQGDTFFEVFCGGRTRGRDDLLQMEVDEMVFFLSRNSFL